MKRPDAPALLDAKPTALEPNSARPEPAPTPLAARRFRSHVRAGFKQGNDPVVR